MNKISTRLLTVLIKRVIFLIEQRKHSIFIRIRFYILGGKPMNISKFTQKSIQAVQNLEKLLMNTATRKSNRSICCIPC